MAPKKRKAKGPGASAPSSKGTTDAAPIVTTTVRSEALYPPSRSAEFREGQHPTRPAKKGKETTMSLSSRPIYKDRVWVIDGFLTPSECEAWVTFGEDAGFEEAYHPATRDTAYRDNGRIEMMSDDVAERIWKRLKPFAPPKVGHLEASGCYSKIRLYRYREGQRFGKHIDESAPTGVDAETTGVTVLIYLNDAELVGGETVFYRGNYGDSIAASFAPKQGSLLFHGYVVSFYSLRSSTIALLIRVTNLAAAKPSSITIGAHVSSPFRNRFD